MKRTSKFSTMGLDNMKIIIYYFSGTGNTKTVVNLLKSHLDTDHDCQLFNIEDINKNKVDFPEQNNAMIGLAYPIYGGDTPHNIYEFVDRLPAGDAIDLFILNTAADYSGSNNNASKRIIKRLEAKYYHVFYERTIAMGSNYFLEYPDTLVKQLYETAKLKTKHMSEEIINGVQRIRRTNPFLKAFAYLGYKGETFAAKRFGKKLKVSDDCILCGKCARNCPVNNIILENDKLSFSDKCIWCMRCIYECPQNAIKPGILKSVVLKGGYNIKKIIKDDSISGDFVNEKTRGFYKHFLKYVNDPKI